MPDAYEIHDGAFLQQKTYTSAADALIATLGPVPGGRVWSILSAYINTSVSETQDFWFALTNYYNFPVTLPQEFTTDPATAKYFPMLREGMELKLFPNEYLKGYRDAATAGSTISLVIRYIETDLQYYVELDKQKNLQRRMRAMEASSPGVRGSGGFIRPATLRDFSSPIRTPRER